MRRVLLVVACALLASIDAAPAQTWPIRPVTLIVPFGAGGPVDTLARTLSEAMRASLGQPVLIENVTGASGTIGVGRAVRAAPDGYTVSIGNWPSHVVNGAIYSADLRRAEGFRAGRAAVRAIPTSSSPARTCPPKDLKELIAWLKANPDKATQGTAGARLRPARQRRLFPERHRHQFPVRAVSRRLLRDHARPGRRAHRPDLRPGDHRAAACPQRHGARPMRSPPTSGSPRRPTSRPSTRPARPASTSRPGTACGCPRARRRRRSQKLTAAAMDALADPAVRERLASLGQEIPPPRAADRGGARRPPQGRDREMVAADQGRQHQGRVSAAWTSSSATRGWPIARRRAARHRHRERPHRRDRARARRRRARSTTRRGASPARA